MRKANSITVAGVIALASLMVSNESQSEPKWGYRGENGPTHWAELSKDFRKCRTGAIESPINITHTVKSVLSSINFAYTDTELAVVNDGHTIKVNYQSNAEMKVRGKRYKLLQFHFHSPSEHKINGKSYPLEMHAVHENAAGELAVVTVLFERGSKNEALEPIWQNMPTHSQSKQSVKDVKVNVADLLPPNKEYYYYTGSLTTPPCTEGVRWYIIKDTKELARWQIERFKEVMGNNSRPTQPHNGRVVLSSM